MRFEASVALASRGVDEGVSVLLENVEGRADLVPEGIRTVPLWQAAIPFLGIAGRRQGRARADRGAGGSRDARWTA